MKLALPQFMKRGSKKAAHDKRKSVITPDTEWRRIFFIFWISFACIAGWSLYMYYSYVSLALPGIPQTKTGVVLSAESFKTVFADFEEKARVFGERKTNATVFVDPSVK